MSTGPPPQLAPTVSDPIDPTTELSLLEQLADPSTIEPQAPAPTPLGRTYAFDFVTGRLIPGEAGGPLMLYGTETLKAWVRKFLATDRAAAPVHISSDYGLDGANEIIDGSAFDQGAMSELESRIRDGIKVHPRIADIQDFWISYTPGDDAAFVSFTVIVQGDDADPLQIVRYPLTAQSPLGGD